MPETGGTTSPKYPRKDLQNRENGLRRLEKRVESGKLSKQHINNRGYNKYLKLVGDIDICIDYEKYQAYGAWDGLKGYVTNTKMSKEKVVAHYQNLWHIEKAFRISKTDLRIRPVYHRLRHRIEAHLCICFVAYALYKELERMLVKHKINISVEKALEQINEIQQITYILPRSGRQRTKLLKLNLKQEELLKVIE